MNNNDKLNGAFDFEHYAALPWMSVLIPMNSTEKKIFRTNKPYYESLLKDK